MLSIRTSEELWNMILKKIPFMKYIYRFPHSLPIERIKQGYRFWMIYDDTKRHRLWISLSMNYRMQC